MVTFDLQARRSAGLRNFFRLIAEEARALRGRWRIARLRRLDDRMLKDIGVERADLDWALMLPASRDPVAALIERVKGHRARLKLSRSLGRGINRSDRPSDAA